MNPQRYARICETLTRRLPDLTVLILYEAQHQRQNAGMYQRQNSMQPQEDQQCLLFEGGYPMLARVAKRKGLPWPHINEQGEIDAAAVWWTTMQSSDFTRNHSGCIAAANERISGSIDNYVTGVTNLNAASGGLEGTRLRDGSSTECSLKDEE